MKANKRFRVTDLRRFGIELAEGLGLAPLRAAALVTHLLWFETAGLGPFGLATLPDWLDRIERDPNKVNLEPRIGNERPGTATLDGQDGLGPLVLARAGALAQEKAREVGLALIRVTGVDPIGPTAPIAAEIAVGPMVGLVIGPGGSWSLALPSGGGLPWVADSVWMPDGATIPPFASALASEGEWLVQAVSVTTFGPWDAFRSRLATLDGRTASIHPAEWEKHRQEAARQGVTVASKAWAKLEQRGQGLRLAVPGPIRD